MFYHGTTSISEAMSKIVKCYLEVILDKQRDDMVYVEIDDDYIVIKEPK